MRVYQVLTVRFPPRYDWQLESCWVQEFMRMLRMWGSPKLQRNPVSKQTQKTTLQKFPRPVQFSKTPNQQMMQLLGLDHTQTRPPHTGTRRLDLRLCDAHGVSAQHDTVLDVFPLLGPSAES